MATARITKAKSLLSTATARLESQLVRENASFVCDEGAGHNNEAGLPSGGDDRAGHEMGLALFGTSSSYLEEIDKEYEERLDSIEGEIDAIRAGLDGLGDCPTSGGDDAIDWQGVSIETMKRHVELLQICHQCKLDLEQIDTLSLSASHGGGVLNFSPSSMLFSPSIQSSDRFHFEKGNGDKSTVVHAARLVRKIDDSLNSAVQILNESGKENADANTYQDNPQLNQMHAIVNELKHQVRRKKMELRHRAISSLEGCITIDASKLSVRGTTVNSDKVGFAEATTPREGQKESCPLSDAYDVLEAFNNPQFPTFGETLERAIKTIGGRLVGLFEASMKELDANDVVGYYTFKQETFKSAPARSKYDVSIKGQGIQLVWELRKMDFVSTFGKATTIVSVASEMSGELLASSAPLASVATFLSCLNFLTQVMGFVHQHVLLQRRDLAVSLGKYLFGTYPIQTSLSSGSAVLGGILVGCAAQGEERGEVRPLMVKLLSLMRKWCIPSKSGEGVWNMIPEIQRVLMEEVGAFEGRMVELGFMGEEIQSAFGTASPSGLSVLVNSDEVASPIHTDSSFKRSLIEISSPPTEHNNTNTAVRSSLSEIAYLFPQAYSESQRSQILNQGRNVLVNTDYHNSVQVGKFVPPPAEPGTPEHLDEDPLAAFFFQRCSISTTAQKTLELVRQTLDQATQPSMAKELDALPPMLYRASRELLDLFRAMIPTLYASEISSIPRMAAILHNDCVYLAHEASLLGAEYKSKFRSDTEDGYSKTQQLSEVCTFIDMVPPFRVLATKSMGSMLELQKSQLFELVSPRLSSFEQSLSSNDSVVEWDDAETALRAALYHLRHLSQSWSQVLSREVYHLALGNLVDTIFTLLLDPIFAAKDITDAASRFLHSLFLDAARGCAEVFLVGESSTTHPATSPAETNQQIKVAVKYSMLFEKLQCIGQFMTMRLDDITRGLEEGVFRSVTGKELTHLVTATYDESAKRNDLLKVLASR